MPDFLRVVPICDDIALNGILQRQHTALTQRSRQTQHSWTDVTKFVARSVQGSGVRGCVGQLRATTPEGVSPITGLITLHLQTPG